MRIIGGKFKGRKLSAPLLSDTRPTTDFARESLFNLLQTRIDLEGISVLDLFCGTGAIAFECISRDVAKVTCVDTSAKALQFIRETSKAWECNISTVKSDVFRFLSSDKNSYDLIFADPPYELPNIERIPELVFASGLLRKNGLLIVEHGKQTDMRAIANFTEHRLYGKVNFSFFSI